MATINFAKENLRDYWQSTPLKSFRSKKTPCCIPRVKILKIPKKFFLETGLSLIWASGPAIGYYFKILCGYIACVASVSVRFRSKERGTRVNFRAAKIKNAVQELVVPRSFFAPKPHRKTLATQAIFQKDLTESSVITSCSSKRL